MAGLRIIVTGGTFDKVYNHITERFEFTETHAPEILKLGRVKNGVVIEKLMMVDSNFMSDSERRRILKRCQECPESRILVTHGTSTLVETARLLGRNLEHKTVVLTGAMVPYVVRQTDAVFNFAFAYGSLQALPAGVYIAMNGKIFHWSNVRKDKASGTFDTLG